MRPFALTAAPSQPTFLGEVWIGETCPSPEDFAAALAAEQKPLQVWIGMTCPSPEDLAKVFAKKT